MLGLHEHLHISPISTALIVDPRTLVTAGADCVVSIWSLEQKFKATDIQLRSSLFGHRHPITSLAASKSLSTLISADAAGRVLMWDLTRAEFIRELCPGPVNGAPDVVGVSAADSNAKKIQGEKDEKTLQGFYVPRQQDSTPVRAISIGPASGLICVASGRRVDVHSLNGVWQAGRDVCDESAPEDGVTAVEWYEGSTKGEWVDRVLFTGHRSGALKVCVLGLCVASVSRFQLFLFLHFLSRLPSCVTRFATVVDVASVERYPA